MRSAEVGISRPYQELADFRHRRGAASGIVFHRCGQGERGQDQDSGDDEREPKPDAIHRHARRQGEDHPRDPSKGVLYAHVQPAMAARHDARKRCSNAGEGEGCPEGHEGKRHEKC